MTERLADVLSGMESGAGKTIKLCGLVSLWQKIVDERVAKNTEAVKIRNRVLYVLAASPAWATELTFFKSGFIEKFNREAGGQAIRDIRFKAGG